MNPTNSMNSTNATNSRLPTILVTGAKGQLGSDIVNVLKSDCHTIPVDIDDFDITDLEATIGFIKKAKPNAIIHSAAFTDVDACGSQQDKAFAINGLGTRNVAIAAREVSAKLFYVSTDYVFDGTKPEPYREYDPPNPQTVYGQSKLMGEGFVREQLNKFFIIRIAWLYGQHGNNFLKTMLKLAQEKKEIAVVNDQNGSPTWTVDVARQIKKLLPTEAYGTYHCTSQGSCTWYEFALEIFKSANYSVERNSSGLVRLIPSIQDLRAKTQDLTPTTQSLTPIILRPVTSEEFPRPAKRPANSVLDNYTLRIQGLDLMPHWKESLHKFMKAINRQQSAVNSQQSKG